MGGWKKRDLVIGSVFGLFIWWEQVGACWGQTPRDWGLGRFNELNVKTPTSPNHPPQKHLHKNQPWKPSQPPKARTCRATCCPKKELFRVILKVFRHYSDIIYKYHNGNLYAVGMSVERPYGFEIDYVRKPISGSAFFEKFIAVELSSRSGVSNGLIFAGKKFSRSRHGIRIPGSRPMPTPGFDCVL